MTPSCDSSTLAYHTKDANIFITLRAVPDAETFSQIQVLLDLYAHPTSRLFLDVMALSAMEQQTIEQLRQMLSASPLTAHNIYYKGQLGFLIAENGNRVIVMRPHHDTNGARRPSLAARHGHPCSHHSEQHAGEEHHHCHCDGKGGCGCGGHGGCCHHHHDHEHAHSEVMA